MNYSRFESQVRGLITNNVLFYSFAVVLVVIHIALTQLGIYWTHPGRSDPSRTPFIALVCFSLTGSFIFVLHKDIRCMIADRVELKEGLSQINSSFTLFATLSLVAVACNFVGLFLDFPPEYLWLALAGALGLLMIMPNSNNDDYQPEVLRGTTIQTIEIIQKKTNLERSPDASYDCWMGLRYDTEYSREHCLTVGTTFSGKTVAARIHMNSTLRKILPGSGWRALIFDPKGEMLSLVQGMAPQCDVHLMKATDFRSAEWWLSNDIDSSGISHQVSSLFVTMNKGESNPFFVEAARNVLASVMDAFILTRPAQWTLSDILMMISDKARTEQFLRSVPQTRHRADQCFGNQDSRTVDNVFHTLYAHLTKMESIAAAWSHSTEKISLKAWLQEESILILGHDEKYKSSMQAVNLAMLECLHQLVLSQSESETRRTLLYLDELPLLGKWESLPLFLDMSRSKGACVFLSFQLIEHMRAIYGDQLADAIAGLPGNKAFLRSDSIATARWVSETIGKCDVRRYSFAEQFGRGKNVSRTEVRDLDHPAVLPSEIMRLPRANRERFYGYFLSPMFGAFHGPVYFKPHLAHKGDVENFVPRPVSHEYLHHAKDSNDKEKTHFDLDDITRVTADSDDDSILDGLSDPLYGLDEPLDDICDLDGMQY